MAITSSNDERDVDLRPRLAELETALVKSHARVTELEAQLAKFVEQHQELTEKLNQDSTNSHLSPSSDGPGKRRKKNEVKAKAKDKRKPGGQKGHPGAHRRLLPAERVTKVIDLFPALCLGCGATLPRTPDSDPRRDQLLDLGPHGVKLSEFRRHEVSCKRCGHWTRAAYDKTLIPASPFGPRLVAVVALLTGTYHLSRRSAQRLLQDLFEIKLSVGALSSLEARASRALEPAYNEAQRVAESAEVKYIDATTWLRAGITMSLWVLSSAMATVYRILNDGRRETIRPHYGALDGIKVSDRASVFDFWQMGARQICWAHLLRKFVSFSQRDGPAGTLGRELLDCTALLFEYWHGHTSALLDRQKLAAMIRPVEKDFMAVLKRAAKADIPRLSGSCANILAHGKALWTFVTHEGVEPTNNRAERDLRPFVLWRRRSFGSRSERGERFAERVMTVVHTARKQGVAVLDFIERSVKAMVEGTPPPSLVGASAS